MSIIRAGKVLARPFTDFASYYTRVAKAKPLVTAFVTSGLKTSAADMFAQKIIEGRDEMDWKRHGIFVTFGFLYLGGFQYYLYNVKFTQICAPLTAAFGHKAVSPLKTFLDQGIHHPFIYFPTFFLMKTVLEGKPDPVTTAWNKYQAEIWDSCKACWAVWVPAQLINFAFVPRHFRVPFVALTSFGWTIIFSTMQGNRANADKASDELKEAQLAVVGTSFDAAMADKAHLTHVVAPTPPVPVLGSPTIPALPASLEAVPSAAEAVSRGSGASGGSGVKAHAALEPRLWELYCKERRA